MTDKDNVREIIEDQDAGGRLALAYVEETGVRPDAAREASTLIGGATVLDRRRIPADKWKRREELQDKLTTLMVTLQLATDAGGEWDDTLRRNIARAGGEVEDGVARRVIAYVRRKKFPKLFTVTFEHLRAALPSSAADIDELREIEQAAEMDADARAARLKELLTVDGELKQDPEAWLDARGAHALAVPFRLGLTTLALQQAEKRAEVAERLVADTIAERAHRGAKKIQWGTAGYNATSRTRRMVEDLVERRGLELKAKDAQQLASWDPSTLPLDARIVFLGCLAALTQKGLMPDLSPNAPPKTLEPILVPLPGGWSELADFCGYERTQKGEFGGEKHARSTLRQMQSGLAALTNGARDLFHVWEEFDKKEGKKATRYLYAKTTIAQIVSEGTIEASAGSNSEMFMSPYAVYIGLQPMALLGARTNYQELPGDFLSRYRQALESLTEKAKKDKRVLSVIGAKPRMTESDLEFLLWCVMHTGRRSMAIRDELLMDRIGLRSFIEQRKKAEADRRLARAIEVAKVVGVLEAVDRTEAGVPLYVFPAATERLVTAGEPEGIEGGTISLELFDE